MSPSTTTDPSASAPAARASRSPRAACGGGDCARSLELWAAWDAKAVEALARLEAGYQDRIAESPGNLPESAAGEDIRDAWDGADGAGGTRCDERFAAIANGVEQSFSGAGGSMLVLGLRFNAFEERVEEALGRITTGLDGPTLRTLADNLGRAASSLSEVRSELARLGSLESVIAEFAGRLSGSGEPPAGRETGPEDLFRLSERAKEEAGAASELSALRGRVESLHVLVESLRNEQRQSLSAIRPLIEAVERTMNRVLDRLDAFETGAGLLDGPPPHTGFSAKFENEAHGG